MGYGVSEDGSLSILEDCECEREREREMRSPDFQGFDLRSLPLRTLDWKVSGSDEEIVI
jgi:hypothetical protein